MKEEERGGHYRYTKQCHRVIDTTGLKCHCEEIDQENYRSRLLITVRIGVLFVLCLS